MNVRYLNTHMKIQSEKRQAVLDATLELVAENGLHNTPMSQISKKAKVSAGAIYHYFESKEVLINQLYLELKKEIARATFKDLELEKSYKDRFILIWLNSYEYFANRPNVVSFIEQCSNSPVLTEETKQAVFQFQNTAFDFIQQGIDQGLLKQQNILVSLSLMYGAMVSLLKLTQDEYSNITDLDRDAAAQFCWDGLKK